MRETGKSVTRRMSAAEAVFHWIMILCTFGLWTPLYLTRKRKLERTTVHYS